MINLFKTLITLGDVREAIESLKANFVDLGEDANSLKFDENGLNEIGLSTVRLVDFRNRCKILPRELSLDSRLPDHIQGDFGTAGETLLPAFAYTLLKRGYENELIALLTHQVFKDVNSGAHLELIEALTMDISDDPNQSFDDIKSSMTEHYRLAFHRFQKSIDEASERYYHCA